MTEIKAGIIAVTEFMRPGKSSYKGYIDYIGRKSAVRSDMPLQKQYSAYMDYMDNPEKSTGLFTAHSDSLTTEERRQIKERFAQAQEKGSFLWQTVVSFDNTYLEHLGLYDAKANLLDEKKLLQAIRQGAEKMYEKEGFLNILWTAAIHYNTDNIHVHIAAAEPEPMREKKSYTVYRKNPNTDLREPQRDDQGNIITREEYKGRFKASSLQTLKREIASELTSNKEITAEINRLIRENIVGAKQETQLLLDGDIRQQLFKLYEKLPREGNRNLWNYKSPAMAHLRSEIDAISKAYIEKYHPADYARLVKTLEEQAEVYRMTYGVSRTARSDGRGNQKHGIGNVNSRSRNDRNDYAQHKLDDLYYRLGNAILRELRDYDRTMEIQQRAALVAARKEEYRRNSAHINKLRRDRNIEAAAGTARMQIAGAGRDFDKAWLQLKKALERECREWKEEMVMRGKEERQME